MEPPAWVPAERYVGPGTYEIKRTKAVWRPLASYQPWPLDRVEPVAWRWVEEGVNLTAHVAEVIDEPETES